MPDIGSHLAQTRRFLGWTLRQAEHATGISNGYISQLETGQIKQPSPDVLAKLAIGYGLSYPTLMEAAGYKMPEDRTDHAKVPVWLEAASELLTERDWQVVEAVVQVLVTQKEDKH